MGSRIQCDTWTDCAPCGRVREPRTDERIKCLLAPIDAYVVQFPSVAMLATESRFHNQRRGVILAPWHEVMEAR